MLTRSGRNVRGERAMPSSNGTTSNTLARLEGMPFGAWHKKLLTIGFFGIFFDAADFALFGGAQESRRHRKQNLILFGDVGTQQLNHLYGVSALRVAVAAAHGRGEARHQLAEGGVFSVHHREWALLFAEIAGQEREERALLDSKVMRHFLFEVGGEWSEVAAVRRHHRGFDVRELRQDILVLRAQQFERCGHCPFLSRRRAAPVMRTAKG